MPRRSKWIDGFGLPFNARPCARSHLRSAAAAQRQESIARRRRGGRRKTGAPGSPSWSSAWSLHRLRCAQQQRSRGRTKSSSNTGGTYRSAFPRDDLSRASPGNGVSSGHRYRVHGVPGGQSIWVCAGLGSFVRTCTCKPRCTGNGFATLSHGRSASRTIRTGLRRGLTRKKRNSAG